MKRRSIYNKYIVWALAAFLLMACTSKTEIPAVYTDTEQPVSVYPDYKDIVIPPNIAPLNFLVRSPGKEFVAVLEGDKGLLAATSRNGSTICFEQQAWQEFVGRHKGESLKITVYAHTGKGWVRYPSYPIRVADEDIDPYVSYRLIEPGYSLYRQLGLYQRNLTGFEEQPIYENNRTFDFKENHCVNCHNYQNYSTRNMLFHVRTNHRGTVIARGDKIEKIDFAHDSIIGGAVYPAWHPQRDWLVFSSNKTGQAFHTLNREKVEVIDQASDLIFYDAERKEVRNIFQTDSLLETFPHWSPEGDRIYYCVADLRELHPGSDKVTAIDFLHKYDRLRYNIMSMPFDPSTGSFGNPQLEVDCAANGKSASVPRISPDGRFILFTQGDYGQFHIWHKSADLYVKDLKSGNVYPLEAANSNDADSYHSWSSNGRWIVFSSRRDDGSYTRLYIAYFDRDGQAHKAFLLPQEKPEQNMTLLKSYNVPELTKDKVAISPETFRQTIYQTQAESAAYR